MGQEIKIHTADVVRSGQGHWLGSSMLDHHNLVRAVSQIPWVKMGTSHIFAYFNPAQVAPGLLFNCFPSLASLFLLHMCLSCYILFYFLPGVTAFFPCSVAYNWMMFGDTRWYHYHTHTFFFPETVTYTEATGSHITCVI